MVLSEKIKDLKSDLNERYRSDPEVLKRARRLLNITWLHGSKASVIHSACTKSSGELLPTGMLQERGIPILTGEMKEGTFGINQVALSGVGLPSAGRSLTYATQFSFDLDADIKRAFSILDLRIPKLFYGSVDFRYFADDFGVEFSRLLESLKRLQQHKPQAFLERKSEFECKLKDLYQVLRQEIMEKKPDYLFSHHDDYYAYFFESVLDSLARFEELIVNPLPPLIVNEEENLLAALSVIFASQNKYGVPPNSLFTEESEEPFYGALKLGREIRVIFAHEANIASVQALLARHNLQESVQLESMDVLKVACWMDRALAPYFYDVLNLRKWKKLADKPSFSHSSYFS